MVELVTGQELQLAVPPHLISLKLQQKFLKPINAGAGPQHPRMGGLSWGMWPSLDH